MLFIWRGVGILVPIVFVVVFIGLAYLIKRTGINLPGYLDLTFISVVLFCSITGFIGYWVNYKKRIVEDNYFTGKKDKSPSHTFFFIPVEYWAVIVPVVIYGIQFLPKVHS